MVLNQAINKSDAQRSERRTRRAREKAERQTQKSRHFCSCRNFNSGSSDVTGEALSHCSIKRCLEPLAWNVEYGSPIAQNNCPLFMKLPKELRDLIFEYALTEDSNACSLPVVMRRARVDVRNQTPDRPENLLLTCWAIYLETYLLPIRLNPIRFSHLSDINQGKPRVTLPWQFANIQALDITLPQAALEGDSLKNFLLSSTGWQPGARHNGVYVSPYTGLKNTDGGTCRSWDFTLLPAYSLEDKVLLKSALGQVPLRSDFQAPTSNMYLQRARPLIHLTLRMPSRNWWTWTDDPNSTDITRHHLGLEPAVGNGNAHPTHRPTCTRMQELAQQRRDGYLPGSRNPLTRTAAGWAHVIASLPDIKTLDMVLETFQEKKQQLDKVIECAKTWRFPIGDSHFELAWNGRVEENRWSKPVVEGWETLSGQWYSRSRSFEKQTIRFTRRRVTPVSGEEDCKVH